LLLWSNVSIFDRKIPLYIGKNQTNIAINMNSVSVSVCPYCMISWSCFIYSASWLFVEIAEVTGLNT